MTDTTTMSVDRNAGEFCGSCGTPVKFYWASCKSCQAPLEVKPVGSTAAAAPLAPPATPGRPQRSGSDEGDDVSVTQTLPAAGAEPWPPRRSYGAPGPSLASASRDHRAANASASIALLPPAAPNQPKAAAPAAYEAPRQYQPAPAYEPAHAYGASPAYEPASAYEPATAYERPQQFPPPSFQVPAYQPPPYPPPTATYQPSYIEPAKPAKSRSLGLLITAIVLGVLLIAAVIFGSVSASKLSTTRTDRNNQVAMLQKAQSDVAAANAALSDANSTKASQSSQLAAYKTCISDLNILFNSTPASAAEKAADKQAQKDCVPLGLG